MLSNGKTFKCRRYWWYRKIDTSNYNNYNTHKSIKIRRNYAIFFNGCGSGLVDLSVFDTAALPDKIKVNSVFADTCVLVKRDSDVRIQANSVFGNAILPGGDNVVFGSIARPSGTHDTPSLEVNAVFGQIRVEYK